MYAENREYLERQREYFITLLERFCDMVDKEFKDGIGDGYFLDWPTSSNREASKSGISGLMRMMYESGAFLAEALGETELSRKALQCIDRLNLQKQEFHGFKQVAAMLSAANAVDKKRAADFIAENGSHGFSSFMAYYLLTALAKGDRGQDALDIMKEYFGMMLEKGATTFFEDYHTEWHENSSKITEMPKKGQKDIHGDFGDYCYEGFRHSLCHGWAAGSAPFLTEYVLGVNVIKPKCREIVIKPQLCGLKWVKGTYPTPFGNVEISHTLKADGTVKTEFTAPKEVKVTVE